MPSVAAARLRIACLVSLGALLGASCGSDDPAKAVRADAGAAGQGDEGGTDPGGRDGGQDASGAAGVPNAGGAPAAGGMPGAGGTFAAGAASGGQTTGLGGEGEGAASPGGTGGDGPLEPAACGDFTPPQPATKPMKVVIANNTSANIYLGSPSGTCQFGFSVFQGQTELQPARDQCAMTCGELQTDGCECVSQCVSIVTLVAPGGTYDIGWPGTLFTAHDMPASCLADASCSGKGCLVEEAVPDGALSIKVAAYPDKQCAQGQQCFDCTPGGLKKNCTVFNASATAGTPLSGSATWTGESTVQIDFTGQ